MKYILGMLLMYSTLFANESLESIYKNILLKNIANTKIAAKQVREDIKACEEVRAKNNFTRLVQAWKSVEAFYVLGDLDDNYLDTPRYIDIFHQGNEDIKEQLDLIIEDNEDLSVSLYKNSHKTINALEYILYTKNLKNKRVKNIALIIINKLEENLQEIQEGYEESKELFVGDEKKANAMMLNALIENSYKLKEWRVGDPAGLSRKYKGKIDNQRGEYFISKNSTLAIEAILNTHLQVLAKQDFNNFATMIESYEVQDELYDAVKYLNKALEELRKIKNDDFAQAKPLYKVLKKLHITYYISLIGKLKITSKILDADGD